MSVTRSGGGFKRLIVAIKELDKHEVKVGFFETAKYPDGTSVAYVATIQEFGAPEVKIPPRPFFRPTIAAQSVTWNAEFAAMAKMVLTSGLDVRDGLDAMGLRIAGDVAKTIQSVMAPPLKPSTIRNKKGATKPLIDTGQMFQSITSEVVEK